MEIRERDSEPLLWNLVTRNGEFANLFVKPPDHSAVKQAIATSRFLQGSNGWVTVDPESAVELFLSEEEYRLEGRNEVL